MESTSSGKHRRINALASEVARHQQVRKSADFNFNSRRLHTRDPLNSPESSGLPSYPRPRRFRKPYHSDEVTRGPLTKGVTDRQREEVERFLRTGESDPLYLAWPGDVFQRSRIAEGEMRAALVDDVHKRARAAPTHRCHPTIDDLAGLTRQRVEPMVRGLFPTTEHDPVLQILERSVVVLTPENIASVLRETTWMHTAWDLANLYLTSVGASLLSAEADGLTAGQWHRDQ